MDIDGIKVLDSKTDKESKKTTANFEEILFKNRWLLVTVFIALILLGAGFSLFKSQNSGTVVEVVEDVQQGGQLVVEVAGAVEKPGVYELADGSRVEDLLLAAGGIAADADRTWMEKALNRAAKLGDGQKLYIPYTGEQSAGASANNFGLYQNGTSVIGTQTEGLTNINTATLSELDKLPGIGPVYGQKIIDQRPYSSIEELSSKSVVPASTYEKLKNLVSVY